MLRYCLNLDTLPFYMALSKSFFGLPQDLLVELRDQYVECVKKIAVVGQSYSISGRTFSHANLSEVKQTLQEIQAALREAQGVRITNTYANFSTESF